MPSDEHAHKSWILTSIEKSLGQKNIQIFILLQTIKFCNWQA